MNVSKITLVVKKYKKCPQCGSSWKKSDLQVELQNEIIKISCKCGFLKYVNENNEELIRGKRRESGIIEWGDCNLTE